MTEVKTAVQRIAANRKKLKTNGELSEIAKKKGLHSWEKNLRERRAKIQAEIREDVEKVQEKRQAAIRAKDEIARRGYGYSPEWRTL